jgi:hypothetical protein
VRQILGRYVLEMHRVRGECDVAENGVRPLFDGYIGAPQPPAVICEGVDWD